MNTKQAAGPMWAAANGLLLAGLAMAPATAATGAATEEALVAPRDPSILVTWTYMAGGRAQLALGCGISESQMPGLTDLLTRSLEYRDAAQRPGAPRAAAAGVVGTREAGLQLFRRGARDALEINKKAPVDCAKLRQSWAAIDARYAAQSDTVRRMIGAITPR